MDSNTNKILNSLKLSLTESFGSLIRDVVLFGSYAEHRQTVDSDFDVLIILDKPFNWQIKDRIRDICYEISLDNNILIDSKIISVSDLTNSFWGKQPLFSDALKYGIYA